MWHFNRLSGFGVQTRQYSTASEGIHMKKILQPSSLFGGLVDNFSSIHRISTEKRFSNPNFVNKQNPNIHKCQSEHNVISETCSDFIVGRGGGQNSNMEADAADPGSRPSPLRSDSIPIASVQQMEPTLAKEDCRRKRRADRKRSHASPRKSNKGTMKNCFNIKYEIDEIGIDPLNESFDSDAYSSSTNDSSPCYGKCEEAVPHFGIFKADIMKQISSSSPVCISIGTPENQPTVVISINGSKMGGCHNRLPSECGSEDSFIVFQCTPDEDSDVFDSESDTDSDDEDSDDSSCSESYFNVKTDDSISCDLSTSPKKVRFAEDLCTIHPMVQWSYAYRSARRGPWEQYARDRCRFSARITKAEDVLGPVLQPEHRAAVYAKRFCCDTG